MTDASQLTRFTRGSIADRQAALRGLHRAVLRWFLETGAPPTARWYGRQPWMPGWRPRPSTHPHPAPGRTGRAAQSG